MSPMIQEYSSNKPFFIKLIRRDVFINKDAPQFVIKEENEEDQIISKDSKEDLQTSLNQQNIQIGIPTWLFILKRKHSWYNHKH
jgi:hypothetical protein